MCLVQEGKLCKFPQGVLLEKDSYRLRVAEYFLKDPDALFSLSQMKRLQKLEGCDYQNFNE